MHSAIPVSVEENKHALSLHVMMYMSRYADITMYVLNSKLYLLKCCNQIVSLNHQPSCDQEQSYRTLYNEPTVNIKRHQITYFDWSTIVPVGSFLHLPHPLRSHCTHTTPLTPSLSVLSVSESGGRLSFRGTLFLSRLIFGLALPGDLRVM